VDPLLHFLPGEEGKGSAVSLGVRLSVVVSMPNYPDLPCRSCSTQSSRTIPNPYGDNLRLLLDGLASKERPLTSAHDPEKKPGARGILGWTVGRARSGEGGIRNHGKPDEHAEHH